MDLGPCQTFMIELFCENNQQVKADKCLAMSMKIVLAKTFKG